MKTRNRLFLVWIMMFALELPAPAETPDDVPPASEKSPESSNHSGDVDPFDPDTRAPKLVRVQAEFIELSHEALTKLLFLSKPASADSTELRKQVQEMVSKNEAKVIETQMITAKSGQKATTESIHEFIYPTEYSPPGLPGSFDESYKAPPNPLKINLAPVPTAFDTRNLGSTLEIEPTIDDGNNTIQLRLVPEIVYHTGNTTWYEGKDITGNPFKVMMPNMYVARLNTSLTLINGQYTLAAVVSPKDDKGDTDMTRKVMVFVKCDVLIVK